MTREVKRNGQRLMRESCVVHNAVQSGLGTKLWCTPTLWRVCRHAHP